MAAYFLDNSREETVMHPGRTIAFMLGITAALCFISPVFAQDSARTPLGPHCVQTGPVALPIDYCGCTWGEVYYRGQPIAGATLTLTFGSAITTTITSHKATVDPPLIYNTSGFGLGASKGDVMTLTVPFASQTITRTFRAWPDGEQEQQVTLVLPEQGVWTPWFTGGYTRTLAVQGDTLWAGGPAGLLTVNLSNNVSMTHTLPWSDSAVVGIAIAPNGHVWAAGPHTLAEFDGSAWQNRTPPFVATIRALTVHPTTGALWLGGGDSSGALAVYKDGWQPVTTVAEIVTALAVDGIGDVWVGTWGSGVYRHNHNIADVTQGWQQYKAQEGLASAYILVIATDRNNVWFGTNPYLDAQGRRGGISRYRLADNTWRTYTSAHGLPADPIGAAAPIYALALDTSGSAWAGSPQGIHLLATPTTWITDTLTSDVVRALVVTGNQIIAARKGGQLLRLDQSMTPGAPPTVQITTAAMITITESATFTLTARATDNDSDANETGAQILAWDWRADNQPLCTTDAICTMPANVLTPGQYTVRLRVQDDEGVWSALVTTTVVVTEMVYLPTVMR